VGRELDASALDAELIVVNGRPVRRARVDTDDPDCQEDSDD